MTFKAYGTMDASYQAAGQLQGITKLVKCFYHYMDSLPQASGIRAMHKADLTESTTKLAYFLSGWLGGPKLFQQHYGSIAIPRVHQHLSIDSPERDAWMLCMQHALDDQDYAADFKRYLMEQLFVPAERVRQASVQYRKMKPEK